MMRHPMHLHGHDLRVLNGQGDYAPLKNVLDIMPMGTDTIEFNETHVGRYIGKEPVFYAFCWFRLALQKIRKARTRGKYTLTRNIAISEHYDSDMGIGFGATLSY